MGMVENVVCLGVVFSWYNVNCCGKARVIVVFRVGKYRCQLLRRRFQGTCLNAMLTRRIDNVYRAPPKQEGAWKVSTRNDPIALPSYFFFLFCPHAAISM